MIDTSPFCKEASCTTSLLGYCRYAPVINARNAADKDKDKEKDGPDAARVH